MVATASTLDVIVDLDNSDKPSPYWLTRRSTPLIIRSSSALIEDCFHAVLRLRILSLSFSFRLTCVNASRVRICRSVNGRASIQLSVRLTRSNDPKVARPWTWLNVILYAWSRARKPQPDGWGSALWRYSPCVATCPFYVFLLITN